MLTQKGDIVKGKRKKSTVRSAFLAEKQAAEIPRH
jgi:hypothetical protein